MKRTIRYAGRVALLAVLAVSLAACGGRRHRMAAANPASAAPVTGASQAQEWEEDSGGVAQTPAGARVERDVAYGSDPAQRMDVYLPQNAHNAPVIFMVHGGMWRFGDKADAKVVENKAARWLPRGFIFISTNYRLHTDPLNQAADVAKAIGAAQSYVLSRGGDASRFIVMGHSAGGHLVGLVASDPALAAGQGAKPWLGTVSLDGQQDIVRRMEAPHQRFLDRAFGSDPAYWRSASPIERLTSAPRPMLLICSTQRAEDSCPQAQGYAAKANSLGGRASTLALDLSHTEINVNLGLPGRYTDEVEAFMRSLGISF